MFCSICVFYLFPFLISISTNRKYVNTLYFDVIIIRLFMLRSKEA